MEKSAAASNSIFRFGSFELRTRTGELLKHGVRVRLQIKPLQALEALLENAGQLIPREQLYRRLWPDATFVDFEGGLNTATNRLRSALGDSAEAPRYIETLPRLGYRFICPVVRIDPVHGKPDELLADNHNGIPGQTVSRSQRWFALTLVPLAAVGTLALHMQSKARPGHHQPIFHQVSFQAGMISAAHFAPNLKRVIYSTTPAGALKQTFSVKLDGSNSEPTTPWPAGMSNSAVVRDLGGESIVEFPPGHRIYASAGCISGLQISPGGDRVAFFEHPVRDDSGGYVRILDRSGQIRNSPEQWNSLDGLVWSPSGTEVWFTASSSGIAMSLYALSETGRLRQVSNSPSSLHLFDISPNGQVLVSVESQRTAMAAKFPGSPAETDISFLDASHIDDMSSDGEMMLFTEGGEGGGLLYSAYSYDLKTHHVSRFASGRALALSPDKNLALTVDPRDRTSLVLTVLRSGVKRRIQGNGFQYQWAKFLPDTQSLLVGGAFPGGLLKVCRQNIAGGVPAPIENVPYMDYVQPSPDGSRLAGMAGHRMLIYDLERRSLITSLSDFGIPVAWSRDADELFLVKGDAQPFRFVRLDLKSGVPRPWVTAGNGFVPGSMRLAAAVAAPEAHAYAYSVDLGLSRLYVVDGWL